MVHLVVLIDVKGMDVDTFFTRTKKFLIELLSKETIKEQYVLKQLLG